MRESQGESALWGLCELCDNELFFSLFVNFVQWDGDSLEFINDTEGCRKMLNKNL